MREIKFRAWDKEQKRLVYDFETTPYFNSRVITKYSVKDCMQYTGLKDKNGVEIYEGDILAVKYDFDTIGNQKVVFKRGQYTTEGSEWSLAGLLSNYKSGVIGNIYENPELLEATQ